jgi:HNH endonuclease
MNLPDRLYGETDDSCALCGLSAAEALTIHHIDGNEANDIYENTIVLCHNCHQRYHQEKGISRAQIETRKRHLIQKTVTVYGVNAMKIAARNNFGVVALPFLLYHLVDLGYMTKEEAQMDYGNQDDATARFAITAKGREVLGKWLE